MKIFIWNDPSQVTNSYHSGGAIVVFSESEEQARSLANKERGVVIKPSDEVTFSCSCDAPEPKVWIFPDAGCC